MSASPSKKQPKKSIHDFFKPYLKTVPAKRPSPSLEEAEQAAGPSRDVPQIATPRKQKRAVEDEDLRTPGSSARSPFSTPGSRALLSIRSRKHASTPVEPPSTYKRAAIFSPVSSDNAGTPKQDTATPKLPVKTFSFADLPSSTQAVVKDGKVIEIRDSDEDDTDSLESLEDLFDRKRGGHTTSLSSTPGDDAETLERERIDVLSMFTRPRANLLGKNKLKELQAKEAAFKFDLSSLLNDHFDDEEIESNVRQARADVDSAAKVDRESNLKVDKKLLASVAVTEDGEQGVARLMDAVDRTEALSSENVFLFFGVRGLTDWRDEEPFEYPFPQGRIREHLWRDQDDKGRSRAYISGYVADLAARRRLHDEALNWTFENVVIEQQDEVRQAYIECLANASSSWTRTNVTAQDVKNVFETLGADNSSVQDSVEIKPRHRLKKEPERRDPRYLLAALHVFQSICADMDFAALSKLTSMVCRLAIDAELMSDGQICAKVEELLDTLLSLPDIETRTHVADRMLADVGQHLRDPTLQAHLLSHIMPTSQMACRVRILLAQVFLLGSDVLKTSNLTSPKISLDRFALHISKSADFDTRRRKGQSTLDYSALRGRIYLLDMAVSDGGRPTTFASRAEENAFNKSLDRLADAVEAAKNNIVDTGASHLTRSEAKNDLQALYMRLLHSVRTEPRPKRHIFDGKTMRDVEDVRLEENGKDFMKRFLEKKTKDKQLERDRLGQEVVQEDAMGPSIGGKDLVAKDDKSASSSSSSDRSETEKLIRKQLGFE